MPHHLNTTAVRVFSVSVGGVGANTITGEVQSWISDMEQDGFRIVSYETFARDGYITISVRMQ